MKFIAAPLATFTIFSAASALIGYNCGGSTLNITTFSTVDEPECDLTDEAPNNEDTEIQLLQLNEFRDTQVIQCRVEIDRTIYHCGMHSHVSIVQNGRQQYILNTPQDVCRQLHSSGTLFLPPAIQITGLLANDTTTRSVTLSGAVQQDGSCHGSTYSDPFGTWTDVVVQAVIKIQLRSFSAAVRLSSDEVYLPSGHRCSLQREYCLDVEDGYTYWKSLPVDHCRFSHYTVLFDGKAVKTHVPRSHSAVVYTVTSGDTAFALTSTGHTSICGYMLTRTEHPKLLILEITKEGRFKSPETIQVTNLDIFTYTNTKFVYLEKHFKDQLTSMYRDVVHQRCQLEKQVLRNARALIHTEPAEVATILAKEPGYMAIQAGETLHLIKCIPVECTLRKTEFCYDELPVLYRNASYFLTPRNHILVTAGTRRDCSELIPPAFKIQGTWYKMMPRPVESLPPSPIQPITRAPWRYVDPMNLANGGIYSPEDISKLNEHIMFPAEKPAVINSLDQGASGREYAQETVSILGLMDSDTIEKIAEDTGHRIWNGFKNFGNIVAGLIGVYVALRVLKLCINTILNGIALHAAYGWSLKLFAACWSALTHFCIYLSRRQSDSEVRDTNDSAAMPLECIESPSLPCTTEPRTDKPTSLSVSPERERAYFRISTTPNFKSFRKSRKTPSDDDDEK